MSNVQEIKGPIERSTEVFQKADFKIYVAPINKKRFSDHIQTKLEKKHSILTDLTNKYVKVKSKATPQSLRKKAKQTYQQHSVLNLLKDLSQNGLHPKRALRKTQSLESTMDDLRKNLEKAQKLHALVNGAIRKNRENLNQKVSDIELGYLSRLVMSKIHRLSLDSEASKSQQFKTIDEIKDIFDIIEEHLQEDINTYLSIDRTQTLSDRKMISNVKKQIKKLRNIQGTFLEMIYHVVQGKRISLRQSAFRRSI